VEAWRTNHKVTVMPAEEFDALLAGQTCLFTSRSDG